MIDLTNYEAYLMLRLDGELLPAEQVELEAFLVVHPELEGEVAAYAATVLAPEEEVVFRGKETLYKSVFLPFYARRVMWAAAAVLLITIGVKLAPEENMPAVAIVAKKEIVIPVQTVAPPAENDSVGVPPAVKVPAQMVAVINNKKSQRPVEKEAEFSKEKTTSVEILSGIALLEAGSDRVLIVGNVLPAAAHLQPVEALEIAAVTPEETPRFAVKLPFLNFIKEAAKTSIPKVQFAGEKLRGTQTTVMLFDRKLFTINL